MRLSDDRTSELEIVRHPGAAAVVAIDERGRVTLIRQYRHAAGASIWEIPAGRLDGGESPAACARRELEEETGLAAGSLEPLGVILTTPGFSDERIHLFLARGLGRTTTRLEADESIERVRAVPLAEAVAMVRRGRIQDAKSALALLLAWDRVGPKRARERATSVSARSNTPSCR